MSVIISLIDGRASRKFYNEKTRRHYLKEFEFKAGVPIELNGEAEEEWARNMAATYPTRYFLSEEEYKEYVNAIKELKDDEPKIIVGGSEEQDDLPTIETLENKSIEELRQLALEVGVGTTPNMTKKLIAKRILAQLTQDKTVNDLKDLT